jgi:hypothetical protein
MNGHTSGKTCVDRYVDVRHRRQIRAGMCLALPALAIALCAALGLSAMTAAHAASGAGHGKTAVAAAPLRPMHALVRMQDPFGLDVVVPLHWIETSHSSRTTVPSTPQHRLDLESGGERNRGPPDGERS